MWSMIPDGWKYWLLFVAPVLAILLSLTGCSTMYPKMLDDPATVAAFQEMIRENNKTWTANGEINNPEVEFYYKISFGARVIGLSTEMGATGAGGPANHPEDDVPRGT